MSKKSALAWYHRNKHSDALKKRKAKRQEQFKTQGGSLRVATEWKRTEVASKHKLRFGVFADRGYATYRHNGVPMSMYHI